MSTSKERKQKARFSNLQEFLQKRSEIGKNYYSYSEEEGSSIWEYDFKLQYNNCGIRNTFYNLDDESDSIERFRKYRNNGQINQRSDFNNKSGDGFDCDGSGGLCELTLQVYQALWNWNFSDVTEQIRSKENLEVLVAQDTLNSFQTTYSICKQYKWADDLESMFRTYAVLTHSIGNFGLVPIFEYQCKIFKNQRGLSDSIRDYFDISLAEILKRYETKKFIRYVNCNFLWDYVDNKYECLSLFEKPCAYEKKERAILNSHTKGLVDGGQALPIDKKEAGYFLENVQHCIKRRGIFMVAMLKIALLENMEYEYEGENKEKWSNWKVSGIYKKIMDDVFLSDNMFLDYNDVIEAIVQMLGDREEFRDATSILTQLKEEIN